MTVTVDYDASADPDLSWAQPVIYVAWDGHDYDPAVGCNKNGLHVTCQFVMATGLLESLVVQVALGNKKYWGDASGAAPAPCKSPAEVAAMSNSSVTLLGTLSLKVDGSAKIFHLCSNPNPKLQSCTGCCSASGPFPYYDGVLKPSCS
ncbi:MAG: hypothetical protein WCW31_03720 [Patescibacteria group bacterium]